MWEIARRRWRELVIVGLLIFVPVGLIEALLEGFAEPLSERELNTPLDIVQIIGATITHTWVALLGEVVFAGIIAAVVAGERSSGPQRRIDQVVRHLPIGRLIGADLVFAVVVVGGAIAFIVPGIVFLVWFALIAPAIEVERLGLRDAFRRSRELVRTRFWLVFWIILPIQVVDESLGGTGAALAHTLFGETFLGEWGSATLANLFTAPAYALAATVLFFQLRAVVVRDSPS